MSESDDNGVPKRDSVVAIIAVIVMSLVGGYLVGHEEGEKYAKRTIYKEAYIRGHGEWRPDENGFNVWHWHKSPDRKESVHSGRTNQIIQPENGLKGAVNDRQSKR